MTTIDRAREVAAKVRQCAGESGFPGYVSISEDRYREIIQAALDAQLAESDARIKDLENTLTELANLFFQTGEGVIFGLVEDTPLNTSLANKLKPFMRPSLP